MIKMKKIVEDHYDDLGDNLSGLGGDLEYHMADVAIAPHEEDDLTDRIDEECIQGMLTWWFRGEGSLPQCPPRRHDSWKLRTTHNTTRRSRTRIGHV